MVVRVFEEEDKTGVFEVRFVTLRDEGELGTRTEADGERDEVDEWSELFE